MNTELKRKTKKISLWLSISFVILFIFRLAYGYSLKIEEIETPMIDSFESLSNIPLSNRNYASKKHIVKNNNATVKVDQKYEKIADIKTLSTAFESEEKNTRKKIKDFSALIQFEQKSGNNGYRSLNLVIGVPPENFDSLYQHLTKIGKVSSKLITKKDKTNEYKELNAKKQSLEKIRTSLISLKSKGGKIEEYMNLENRILEIEQQLQDLGVSLGDFDDENEFCTVNFSLKETRKTEIGTLHRIKVALEWTIKTQIKIMFALLLIIGFSYVFVSLINSVKSSNLLNNKK